MLFRLVGLNIMMNKNGCGLDVFIRIFRLLLKIFIMIADSLKKAKEESIIILNEEKYDQCNQEVFISR